MTNVSNVPNIIADEAESAGPVGEQQAPNAAVIGVGAVAVAAVAAGAGFAAGNARGKKAADRVEGKDE